jgi:hypothetical protein
MTVAIYTFLYVALLLGVAQNEFLYPARRLEKVESHIGLQQIIILWGY